MRGAGMAVEVASASMAFNYHSIDFTHIDKDESPTHQNYFPFNERKLQFPLKKLKEQEENLLCRFSS